MSFKSTYLIELRHNQAELTKHVVEIVVHFTHPKHFTIFCQMSLLFMTKPVSETLNLIVHTAEVFVGFLREFLSLMFDFFQNVDGV